MNTQKNKQTEVLTKLAGLAVKGTITVPAADLEQELSTPRLRVYITRYAAQYGKSFKTRVALNGDLIIMRQPDPKK